MKRGAGGFLSSLHPLSLLPLQCQVCAMAAGAGPAPTFVDLTVPSSAPEGRDGVYWVWRLGQGGGSPTFSLVDIW